MSFKTPFHNQAISFEFNKAAFQKLESDTRYNVKETFASQNLINMSSEAIQYARVNETVKIGTVIGKGSFATVFNGIEFETGKEIAVKVYEKKEL